MPFSHSVVSGRPLNLCKLPFSFNHLWRIIIVFPSQSWRGLNTGRLKVVVIIVNGGRSSSGDVPDALRECCCRE